MPVVPKEYSTKCSLGAPMDSLRDLHDFVKQARRISRNCGRSGQADEKGRISLPYSMGRYAAQTRILTKGSSNAAKTRIGKKVKQFLLELSLIHI